uniref:Uncharacterized protein n=1 Tax=Hyaloperonospora arabidopsidis (strain Emoy2) TaxID=559515 RepID=M4BQ62_HYAAE
MVTAVFWMCGQGSALIMGVPYIGRHRRWGAVFGRAMLWLSTTKANHLTPLTSVTLIRSPTSSVTLRLNCVNLHRFWTGSPADGDK